MSFSRVNGPGWAVGDQLTSAQMNQLDIEHSLSLKGGNTTATLPDQLWSQVTIAGGGRLTAHASAAIVVDMVEEGLDHHSQEAVIAWLRRRAPSQTPLFLMTRSNAILDLAALGADETLIYCPPNHSPPFQVAPIPGAYGYESVAACLGSPAVRARSAKQPTEAI